MSGLEAILATLNAEYSFDDRGRISGIRCEGILPRFVLGRAREGCLWRFLAGLEEAKVAALARLAGREAGAEFEGELPAPPERLVALSRILANAGSGEPVRGPLRREITRDGVVCGELWVFA